MAEVESAGASTEARRRGERDRDREFARSCVFAGDSIGESLIVGQSEAASDLKRQVCESTDRTVSQPRAEHRTRSTIAHSSSHDGILFVYLLSLPGLHVELRCDTGEVV